MFNADYLIFAALLSQIGVIAIGLSGWYTKNNTLLKASRYLSGLTALLLLGGLISLAILRQHFLATTLDEAWLSLSLLIIALYFVAQYTSAPFNIISLSGLALNTLFIGWGTYLLVSGQAYLGLEPLWISTGIGRWLILLAIASLYWLAILALFTLLNSFLKKPFLQTALAEFYATKLKFRLITVLCWLLGTALLIVSSWWRASNVMALTLTLVIPILLFSAALWLRFARTRRSWSESILLLLAFLSALPLLSAISF